MRIRVHLDDARLFRWHLVLLEALQRRAMSVTVSFVDKPEPLPTSLTTLFDYDRARSGAGQDRFSTHMRSQAFAAWPRAVPAGHDVTLDLATSSQVVRHAGRTLRPLYDGSAKDYALFHALLERRAPMLSLADSTGGDFIWNIGLPAIETPWRIATAYDQVTSRLVEGIARALMRVEAGESASVRAPETKVATSRANILSSTSTYASARAARKLTRLREKVSGDEAKWHVAWRMLANSAPPQLGLLNLSDFRTLADDGKRYYADPFALAYDDRRHVFVEEVPAATGRGLISHFEIGADGRASRPRPVLEAPYHLSYPHVFARDGHIWMLPEASASGGLDLYRAERFPDRWVKDARLIDVPLHDATLFEHGGRLWIAAGCQTLQSSSWDGLALYSAESLRGPWVAQVQNPVLIDARAARPAGELWTTPGGMLIRPAQDCVAGYGSRLTLRRIDKLDAQNFAETTIGSLAFTPESRILGPHTISRGAGLEVIDFYARPSALAGYRAPGTL